MHDCMCTWWKVAKEWCLNGGFTWEIINRLAFSKCWQFQKSIFDQYKSRNHRFIVHVLCTDFPPPRRWEGGDPGVSNQKTPTTILLTPDRKFHSFGYAARDFYHDLDPSESKHWLYLEKFKMKLHTTAVRTQTYCIHTVNECIAVLQAILRAILPSSSTGKRHPNHSVTVSP